MSPEVVSHCVIGRRMSGDLFQSKSLSVLDICRFPRKNVSLVILWEGELPASLVSMVNLWHFQDVEDEECGVSSVTSRGR